MEQALSKDIVMVTFKRRRGARGIGHVRRSDRGWVAARGVLFERAYCNQGVCAPSRNALLTGLRPETLGIYDLAATVARRWGPCQS